MKHLVTTGKLRQSNIKVLCLVKHGLCLGVRDYVCELCGSAYFSKKGLRKHERAAHPAQNPIKPKPFKIGEESVVLEGRVPGEGLDRPPQELERTDINQALPQSFETRDYYVVSEIEQGRREENLELLQNPGARETQMLVHQVPRDGGINLQGVQGPREGNMTLQGPREGDMNLQLAYAAALNRHGDTRLTQFFTPLRN